MWFIHCSFEQINFEKITNPKLRKDRRVMELFREKYSNNDFSQISYSTLMNHYKKFIKQNNLTLTESINESSTSNNSINLTIEDRSQISNSPILTECQTSSNQLLMATNLDRTLSNHLNRSLSIHHNASISDHEESQMLNFFPSNTVANMLVEKQNPRVSTPIPSDQIQNVSSEDSEDINIETNLSISSNDSNRIRRKRCLTYRRDVQRKSQYRQNRILIESNSTHIAPIDVDSEQDSQIYQSQRVLPLHAQRQISIENNQDVNFVIRDDPSLHNLNFYHAMHTAAYMDRETSGNQISLYDLGSFGGVHCDENGQVFYRSKCNYCDALFYDGERNKAGHFTLCCITNKVRIEQLPDFPEEYKEMFSRNSENRAEIQARKNFLDYIINYNSLLSFAAISARMDTSTENYRNHFVYKIHGRMYHQIAPARRTDGQNFHMQCGQYYMLDTDQAHRDRLANTNQAVNYIDDNVSQNI